MFSVDIPTPRSSATCLRVSPLVSAIRTASCLNSSVRFSPIVSLLCCNKCYQRSGIKPRQVHTRGGNGSNVFFGSIAQKTESAFVDGFRKLDEEEWLRDLAAQIWRNSEILCLKYKYLKHSMFSTMVGLMPWAIFISLTRFG
ncbi:Pycsar system effector family protein [Pseudorhodobacter turbinis]|uniref:Pycsar system effector family protein n=1 Tax=Pseudorhodobacter turbinis TaxID=2500533 RepID=UPI003B82E42B